MKKAVPVILFLILIVFSGVFVFGFISENALEGLEDSGLISISNFSENISDFNNLSILKHIIGPNLSESGLLNNSFFDLDYSGYIIQLDEQPVVVEEYMLKQRAIQNQNSFVNKIPVVKNIYQAIAVMPEDIPQKLDQHLADIQNEREQVKQRIINNREKAGLITGHAVSEQRTLDIEQEFYLVFNGFSINITDKEAKEIEKIYGVKSVQRNRIVYVDLMDSVSLIQEGISVGQLDEDGNDCTITGKDCLTGVGIKIAIIDTGIDYAHPDFGNCTSEQFLSGNCAKVIGGFDFVNSRDSNGDGDYNDEADINDADPMDDNGHGTHCAGIAAGNGVLKGVAPDAKILAYKVLSAGGSGSMAGVISGIERAVVDGADVLSLSLGGGGNPDDASSTAVDNAVLAGKVVVVAAGNSGSGEQTIGSPGTARNAITVGASNNDLGRNSILSANSLFIDSNGFAGSKIGSVNAELKNVSGVGSSDDFLNSGNFNGKIALIQRGTITFSEKIRNAYTAGAVGVIIYNNIAGSFNGVARNNLDIISVSVSNEQGEYLLNLLDSSSVSINLEVTTDFNYANSLAGFSSRGPVVWGANFIVKPDILAPGVSICAAQFGDAFLSSGGVQCVDNDHVEISGTSMATPHMAGVVALLKQKHSNWTSEEIKSSIKATAIDFGLAQTEQGAGRVNVTKLISLVNPLDFSPEPYFYFRLDSLGVKQSVLLGSDEIIEFKGFFPDYLSLVVKYRKEGETNWRTDGLQSGDGNGVGAVFDTSVITEAGKYEFNFSFSYAGEDHSYATQIIFYGEVFGGNISNCDELQGIIGGISDEYIIYNYNLTEDIDCSVSRNWNCIVGSQGCTGFKPIKNFFGKFYGQNNTISNLYINPRQTDRYASLFESIGPYSEIKDLGLVNITIGQLDEVYPYVWTELGFTRATQQWPYGSLVGIMYGGKILNSYVVDGQLYAFDSDSAHVVGGLVGSQIDGEIINSHVYNTNIAEAYLMAGGIVGMLYSGNISNSSFDGNISAVVIDPSSICPPGVCHLSPFSGSYGGLVGHSWSGNTFTIINSFSSGTIQGYKSLGGLMGTNQGSGQIINSGSNMSIVQMYHPEIVRTVLQYASGGLIGEFSGGGDLSNSYFTGILSGETFSTGGLVGILFGGTLSNSYMEGNISANGGRLLGGIAGSFYNAVVNNSYFLGNVFGSFYWSEPFGYIWPGGSTTISNSFWNFNDYESPYSDDANTHKTLEEMRDVNTFLNAGWNFDDSWGINPGINGGYPNLEIRGIWNCTQEYSDWSVCDGTNRYSTRIITSSNPAGCYLGRAPILSRECPSCFFKYSDWSDSCINGFQNRTIISLNPAGCYLNKASGKLSRECPYTLIRNCEELQHINDLDMTPRAYYKLANDIDCSETRSWNFEEYCNHPYLQVSQYKNSQDCKNNGGYWFSGYSGFEPIGGFGGSFDGQGFKIKNLYINRPSSVMVGLFSSISGSVSSLGVVNANITGSQYVGAITGYLGGGRILNSYSSGNVGNYRIVGGIVGFLNGDIGGIAGFLYNDGAISNCYSFVNVVGVNRVGGLVGGINGGSVLNSYAGGIVSGTGGLIGGLPKGIVQESFWDINSSGKLTSAGGKGKTTEEMKDVNTFSSSGWNFDNVWGINPSINEGYPYLNIFLDLPPEPVDPGRV